MEMNSLLTLGIGIVVILLIIKFVTKLLFKLIGLTIIVAIGAIYMYSYTDYFETHKDNKFVNEIGNKIEKHKDSKIINAITDKINLKSLKEYENKFCKDEASENDKIKCKCIITPILDDLKSKYTNKELNELYKNKSAYIKELLKSFTNNKEKIKKLLEQNDASHLLDETSDNLKKGKFL